MSFPDRKARAQVAFLGGNGHCAVRLAAARRFLPPQVKLVDTPYPGFEGRPRAAGFEAFLDAVAEHFRSVSPALIYGTGIGGLVALTLRARGEIAGVPILLQAPVLWGLERRLMPKLMRLLPARPLLDHAFSNRSFQRRFARKYFLRRPEPEVLAAFYEGYARCSVASDFFAWMTPELLRRLERDFAARPAALAGIRFWWGGRDRAVSPQELEWTRAALGVGEGWPLRIVPEWGHYPMMDEPEAWAGALVRALAASP